MILIFFWQIACICENKIKEKILITLPDYKNFIKSFEMTLNSKHRTEKVKTKDQRYRNTKNQNTERRKSILLVEHTDLYKPALNKIITTLE